MSHKSFTENPSGFIKQFIRRSHSLLLKAAAIGFPYEAACSTPAECTTEELIEYSEFYSDLLLDLQHWLVLKYTSSESEDLFTLIGDTKYLAKRYKIGKF